MSSAPSSPPPAPAANRRSVGSKLLLGASVSLLFGALVHAAGYVTASIAVQNSGLVPHLKNAFRGLWLGLSLQSVVLSGVLLIAALRPGSIAKAAVVLCALLPLLNGALLAAFLASPLHAVFPALAVLLALVGVVLPARQASPAPRSAA